MSCVHSLHIASQVTSIPKSVSEVCDRWQDQVRPICIMITPSAVASALPGEDVVLLPKAECRENAKLARAGLLLT